MSELLTENKKAKKIPLSKGLFALVDEEDYELLSEWKWYASKAGNHYYASRNRTRAEGRTGIISMHRQIMNYPQNMHVDHIDHNTLDNRRINLRVCTQSENKKNQVSNTGTSKYKGVCWVKKRKTWSVAITCNRKNMWIGYYEDEEDAAIVYNVAAQLFFGEFAHLNNV